MLIERIVLGDVKDTCDFVYHTWIDVTKDRPEIVLCSDSGGPKYSYYIESIFIFVLEEKESLFLDYGQGIEIRLNEIKDLCKQIISAIPRSIGTLETRVDIAPCDPRVPF